MNFESIIWKLKPIIEIGDYMLVTRLILLMSRTNGRMI